VWFHSEGIANILSLSNVQKRHNVTYDSTLNQGFVVYKAYGTTQVFRPYKKAILLWSLKWHCTCLY